MSDFIVTHRKSIKNLNIFNNHWRGLLDSFLNDRCNTVPTLQTNECDGMAGNNFKSPSISVIVPAYNVEKYIGRCLDSLIAQTLRNIEIIVINDGSSDSTVSILKNYMKRDKRIVLINCSIASGNAGTPRNIGICKAKGDYIGFVDSDDWVESNMFEKLYEKTLDTDVDIVSTSSFFKHKREEKMVIRLNYIKINREKSNNKDSFKSAYFSNIWNRIYKRELVEKHNIYFPRIYFAEDLCFSTACHIFARSTEIVEGAYYHYNYDRPESTTSLRKGEKGFQVISNFQTMRNYFDHLAIYDEFCAQILQKKFNSLWYTYDRLHDEIKPQFFNEMCRLYNDVKHNIDLSLFTPDLEKRMALLSPTNSCPTAVDIRKSKNLTNQAI
jgi:glycosyltransferase involved in cell wall biosynthesis